MTTIAYKDGVIATDGQGTRGDSIVTLDQVKRYEFRNTIFFLSGSIEHIEEFIITWPTGEINQNSDIDGFAISNNMLYATCAVDGRVSAWLHDRNTAWACGSGADFAIGAMDAGVSAAKAVTIASKRDIHTGGTVSKYCASTGEQYPDS